MREVSPEAVPISSIFRWKDEFSLIFTQSGNRPVHRSFSVQVGIFGSFAGQISCRPGALVPATDKNKVHRNKGPIAAMTGYWFFRAVHKVCRTEEAAIPVTRRNKRGARWSVSPIVSKALSVPTTVEAKSDADSCCKGAFRAGVQSRASGNDDRQSAQHRLLRRLHVRCSSARELP